MAIIAVALIATILPAAAEMSAKQMIESFTKEDTTTIKVYFSRPTRSVCLVEYRAQATREATPILRACLNHSN